MSNKDVNKWIQECGNAFSRKSQAFKPGVFIPSHEVKHTGFDGYAEAGEKAGVHYGEVNASEAQYLVMEHIRKKHDPQEIEAWIKNPNRSLDFQLQYYDWNTLLMELSAINDGENVLRALERGAAVSTRNGNGQTALMFAARKGNLIPAKLLLRFGAKATDQDRFGETALTYSIQSNNQELFELLLSKTPLISWSPRLKTKLILQAANHGADAIMCVLVERKLLQSQSYVASRALAIAQDRLKQLSNKGDKNHDLNIIQTLHEAEVPELPMTQREMYLGPQECAEAAREEQKRKDYEAKKAAELAREKQIKKDTQPQELTK